MSYTFIMNSIGRYTLCSFSLFNLSIILVLCITISTRNEVDAVRSFTNDIIANFKDRICSNPKYASRFTMCKDYLKEDQTTSPPLEMNPGNDIETVTLQVVSEDITQTLQESETKLEAVTNLGRLGVIMSNRSCHAIVSRGPDGIRMKNETSTSKVLSLLGCASSCVSIVWCQAFTFSRQKFLCQLMSREALEYGEFVEEIGWHMYYM